MRRWLWFWLAGWALACDSTVEDARCVPGRQVACDCADGSTAIQVCGDDGRFRICECVVPISSGGSFSSGGRSVGHGGVAGTAGKAGGSDPGDLAGASSGGTPTKPIGYQYGDMSPCDTEGSSLFFSGDSADYIHPGQDLLTVARFTETSDPDTIRFNIEPSGMEHGDWWYLTFSSKQLDAPLAVGEYLNAERWPFQTYLRPGLDVSGDGRGCNTLKGKFVIKKLVWLGPTLSLLDVAFEQHCEGGSSAVRGCLHYDSGLGPGAGGENGVGGAPTVGGAPDVPDPAGGAAGADASLGGSSSAGAG